MAWRSHFRRLSINQNHEPELYRICVHLYGLLAKGVGAIAKMLGLNSSSIRPWGAHPVQRGGNLQIAIYFEHPHPTAVMHKKCHVSWRLGGENITECGVILCAWALQRYSAVGHCRDTWWLGIARIPCGWALQGYLVIGHCRYILRLGTARIFCRWAPQEHVAMEHCRQAPGGGRGQHRLKNLTSPQPGWGTTALNKCTEENYKTRG